MSETVLITGAGIGIGRATAKAFAGAGYKVIVTDVLEEEGRAVAAGISEAGGTAAPFSSLKAGGVGTSGRR